MRRLRRIAERGPGRCATRALVHRRLGRARRGWPGSRRAAGRPGRVALAQRQVRDARTTAWAMTGASKEDRAVSSALACCDAGAYPGRLRRPPGCRGGGDHRVRPGTGRPAGQLGRPAGHARAGQARRRAGPGRPPPSLRWRAAPAAPPARRRAARGPARPGTRLPRWPSRQSSRARSQRGTALRPPRAELGREPWACSLRSAAEGVLAAPADQAWPGTSVNAMPPALAQRLVKVHGGRGSRPPPRPAAAELSVTAPDHPGGRAQPRVGVTTHRRAGRPLRLRPRLGSSNTALERADRRRRARRGRGIRGGGGRLARNQASAGAVVLDVEGQQRAQV